MSHREEQIRFQHILRRARAMCMQSNFPRGPQQAPAAAKHNNALNSPDKITNLRLHRKTYNNSRGW